MDPNLQSVIVILAVVAAIAFIVRRAIRVIRGEKCAGGCGSACNKQGMTAQNAGDSKNLPLVSLDLPRSKTT